MKFQVFKEGKPAEKFDLRGAYLFGTDGIAIRRGEISFRDGILECSKPNMETAGLALLWPIEGFGRILLPTTCLPEKPAPYILNVEIARAKLMQLINKREDWSFFEEIEGSAGGKEAQQLFIKAIQNLGDAATAAKLADEALLKAVVFSEELALKQAQTLLGGRVRSRGFGRGCLGCVVDPAQIDNAQYLEALAKFFGSATIAVNWGEIEGSEGSYDFAVMDKCIATLGRKKLTLTAGPVLSFLPEYLPKWLLKSGMGFEKIRETAYHFVSTVVKRYAGKVRAWRVVGGLNVFNHFGFSFEQTLEMTRAAIMAAKAGSERDLKIIEICNPWGEYYASGASSIPPIVYMDMVIQSGINFDAFGLKLQFGRDREGMHLRDMMGISAVLDSVGPIAKPLLITGVEVPGGVGEGEQRSEAAGVWRKNWDQHQQALWIEQFYKVALSKPFVDSVTYSRLADVPSGDIEASGLLTEKCEPKEAFAVLEKLRAQLFGK